MKNHYHFKHSTTDSTGQIAPIALSLKSYETEVCYINFDETMKKKSKPKLGDLVRTANKGFIFSKGGSANWSHEIYTKTELIDDKKPFFVYSTLLKDRMKHY